MKSASAIDDHGDFVTSDQTFTLYHEGTGLLNLETAVDGPLNDLDFWKSSSFRFYKDMTERGAMNAAVPNFPAICGHLSILYGESRGFILVPITPPTP